MVKRYLNRIQLYTIQNEYCFPQELWGSWDVMLSYLQANKSAGSHYMHASRRHKTLGLGTKDFITHGTASSMSISIFLSSLPPKSCRGHTVGLDRCCTGSGFISQLRNPGPSTFWANSKHYIKWKKETQIPLSLESKQLHGCHTLMDLAYLIAYVIS